jgi:hypothetical protein
MEEIQKLKTENIKWSEIEAKEDSVVSYSFKEDGEVIHEKELGMAKGQRIQAYFTDVIVISGKVKCFP